MDQTGQEIHVVERDADKVSAVFAEKFGILPVIGAAFGNFQSIRWSVLSYTVYVLSYTSVILTTLILLYSSYLLRNNISMASSSLHVFLVGCVVLTASFTITFQRKRITRVMLGFYFSDNVSEYQRSSPYYEMLERKSDLKLQRLMLMFILAYGACGVIGLSAPFFDMYLGNDVSVTNTSGIYWKKLPIAMWWPFDAHNSLGAYISAMMCQGVCAMAAPNMCTAAIMICFYACEKLLNHMRLLIHSVEHLDQRARARFKASHPGKSQRGSETEYDQCYYECIVQNLKHHHGILKAKDDLLDLANYAIAVPFFGGAMLLGLSMLNLLSIGLSAPFVDMFLGNDVSVTNTSGIYWKELPFAMWWPFDAHNSLGAYISAMMCQGVCAMAAPNMCTAAIMICFYACEKLLNHMRLLIHSVEHLDQRARARFKARHPGKAQRGSETEYDQCYYECIVQNVKHHHEILKARDDFLDLANYAIAVPFFGGAMLLGLAMLNLLSHEDPRIGPKMLLFGLGTTEAANMLLLCMYGEDLQQLSEELFNSAFYTRWYLRSLKCRRALMILRWGTMKPMKINAAHLIELNMETFGNLVNSAYSIFNLSAASR